MLRVENAMVIAMSDEIELIPDDDGSGGYMLIDHQTGQEGHFTSMEESLDDDHFGEFGPTGRFSPKESRMFAWGVLITLASLVIGGIYAFSS